MTPRTSSLGQLRCYLCGSEADGPDDHAPPEVLFRGGSGTLYKTPPIVRVPSCAEHNQGSSRDDEDFAWVMSHGGVMYSHVAFDVYQALSVHVTTRIWNDRQFADARLAHTGARVLRDPKDYDEDGGPKRIVYDQAYVARSEKILRERWHILKRSIQKIAAGLYFHVSDREPLGALRARNLVVLSPEMKQVEPEVRFDAQEVDEASFFATVIRQSNASGWTPVISGSPSVFQCEIAKVRNTWRFGMRMRFYDRIRVWVKSANE
jgi:hypothetical protein